MGLRLHRALGYAITDLKYDVERYRVCDDRINYEQWGRETGETFAAFVARKKKELIAIPLEKRSEHQVDLLEGIFLLDDNAPDRIDGCIVHEPEGGCSNVMLFIPPSCLGNWRHRDDDIDTVLLHLAGERSESGAALASRIITELTNSTVENKAELVKMVTEMSCLAGAQSKVGYEEIISGIWPYQSFIDLDSMTHLSWDKVRHVKGLLRRGEVESASQAAGSMFGMTLENFAERVRCKVSPELQLLAEYTGIFTDQKATLPRLKPILYTYWQ